VIAYAFLKTAGDKEKAEILFDMIYRWG